MGTHSSILAQRILWTEEPGELQPMGSKESDTSEHFQLSGASICFSESPGGAESGLLRWLRSCCLQHPLFTYTAGDRVSRAALSRVCGRVLPASSRFRWRPWARGWISVASASIVPWLLSPLRPFPPTLPSLLSHKDT